MLSSEPNKGNLPIAAMLLFPLAVMVLEPLLRSPSMEAEAHRILLQGLQDAHERLPFGEQLREQLGGLGKFPIPPRNPIRILGRASARRPVR